MHRNANYATKERKRLKSNGQYAKVSRPKSICIYYESSTLRYLSRTSRCESHPKCKLKATDNYIKRTFHKVNNPCTRKYKHRCFIPGGNNTSPSLMFLALKLDIRGLNPQSSITFPLGVKINHLAKVKYGNGEHARIFLRTKYKREEPNILLITI